MVCVKPACCQLVVHTHVSMMPAFIISLASASHAMLDGIIIRYVKMLVEHNADLNAADGAGRVPLMLLLRPTTDINAQVSIYQRNA